MITVTIDGLAFEAKPNYPSTGLVCRRLQGWYSGAPVRDDAVDRPASDGAFGVSRAYRSARPLRFEGALFAATTEEAIAGLWRHFSAIQADGRPFPLSVTDATGTLTATVSLSGSTEIEPETDRVARVAARFIAYDPVKYAAPRQLVTGLPTAGGGLTYNLFDPAGALDYGANGNLGRVELTNGGTAEVWPRVRVDGGLADGFFVQRLDTGQTVRYDRVVPLGSWVDIDFATGAVVVDGVSDGSTYLTRGEFFSVPPGAEFDVQFNGLGAASGTPLMTVTIADGFW